MIWFRKEKDVLTLHPASRGFVGQLIRYGSDSPRRHNRIVKVLRSSIYWFVLIQYLSCTCKYTNYTHMLGGCMSWIRMWLRILQAHLPFLGELGICSTNDLRILCTRCGKWDAASYTWNMWGFLKKWITGWWYTYPSEKYELVSWDDYSQSMEKI